jgi:hypothetical protein
MRCKPGQLAVLTGTLWSGYIYTNCLRKCLGAIVTTEAVIEGTLTEEALLGPVWKIGGHVRCPDCGIRFRGLPDSILTPMKGPGPEEDVYSPVSISTDVRAPSRETS